MKITAAVLVAGLALLAPGCSVLELEVTADLTDIGYVVGDPIVGTVEDQHGNVTVALVPAPLDGTMDLAAAVSCDYSKKAKSYSCPTRVDGTDLPLGRYVVLVSDHDEDYQNPDGTDGTGIVPIPVVLTATAGYNPSVGQVMTDDDGSAYPRESAIYGSVGTPLRAALRGWTPGSTVTAQVLAGDGTVRETVKVSVGATGAGNLDIAAVPDADSNSVVVTDGVWSATVQLFLE